MAHEHTHDHSDVELIEEGTTPASEAVADGEDSPQTGARQTWRTYAPALISLVLLLGGIGLDSFVGNGSSASAGWFHDPWRLLWYVAAYAPVGWPVLRRAWSGITSGDVFTEFFLMGVATLGAFAIREYPEGVTVMLFYTIGELFQEAAVLRARRSVKALLDVRPDEVTLIHGGQTKTVRAATVAVGDVIQVKPGEKVGLDGTLRSEQGSFDTASTLR